MQTFLPYPDFESCDGCGVVFDKSKLKFPDDIWDEDKEEYDKSVCDYVFDSNLGRNEFTAFIRCPVCDDKIYNFRG